VEEEGVMINENVSDLEKIVAAMTRLRVTHVEIPIPGQDKALVIDLSPDAWKPEPTGKEAFTPEQAAMAELMRHSVEVKDEPEARCPCGHDPDTEHSEAGCLHGCPDDLCHSGDKEAEA
jgi:hypothetical protein